MPARDVSDSSCCSLLHTLSSSLGPTSPLSGAILQAQRVMTASAPAVHCFISCAGEGCQVDKGKGSGKGWARGHVVGSSGMASRSCPIFCAQTTRPMVRHACTNHGQAVVFSSQEKLAYGGCLLALSRHPHMVYTTWFRSTLASFYKPLFAT